MSVCWGDLGRGEAWAAVGLAQARRIKCYVMLCYVMLCDVVLCCVMLCYVVLCYSSMLCFVAHQLERLEAVLGPDLRARHSAAHSFKGTSKC